MSPLTHPPHFTKSSATPSGHHLTVYRGTSSVIVTFEHGDSTFSVTLDEHRAREYATLILAQCDQLGRQRAAQSEAV